MKIDGIDSFRKEYNKITFYNQDKEMFTILHGSTDSHFFNDLDIMFNNDMDFFTGPIMMVNGYLSTEICLRKSNGELIKLYSVCTNNGIDYRNMIAKQLVSNLNYWFRINHIDLLVNQAVNRLEKLFGIY